MPYDANLVLRGKYGATVADADYVDLDSSDSVATGLAVASTVSYNNDGNSVVDLGPHGTGIAGLDCVIIFHDTLTTYTHYVTPTIEDSDFIAGGFNTILTFPTVYAYMREVIVTATTKFDYDDLGVDLTEGTTNFDGHSIRISRKLETVGGTGKIFIAMQDSGDDYDTPGDTLTSDNGGVGTQVGASRVIDGAGLTIVRRFSTPKRYIRFNGVPSGGNFGAVDVLVTNLQHSYVDNLYR